MIVWDYSVAVFSEWKERALRIARDALSTKPEGGDGDAYEMVQPHGLLSRPMDPDVDADGNVTVGAGLLTAEHGHEGFAMPTTDPRILDKIPELPKGSTVLYASNGANVYLDAQTGDLTVLVPYAEGSTSKAHSLTFDIANKSIQLRHGDGMGVAITAGGKNSVVVSNKAANAYVEVNDDGIVLNGNVQQNGSAVVGNIPAAQGVLLGGPEWVAFKAAVDANFVALQALLPSLAPTGPIVVMGSQVLKASQTP